MLELLELLSVGWYWHEDGADAVTKNAVRKSWRMERVLDLQKFFHALFWHFLNVFLVSLKELEEDANDLGRYLYDVEVKRSLQKRFVKVNDCGRWLLAITRIVRVRTVIVKLIQALSKILGQSIVRGDLTKQIHALANHFSVQTNIWVKFIKISHVWVTHIVNFRLVLTLSLALRWLRLLTLGTTRRLALPEHGIDEGVNTAWNEISDFNLVTKSV